MLLPDLWEQVFMDRKVKDEGINEDCITTFNTLNLGLFDNLEKTISKIQCQKLNIR